MKKHLYSLLLLLVFLFLGDSPVRAQGWPANYNGVMLQAFYWDSFDATKWTTLEKQADELSKYFSLVWIPQSGNCGGQSMGYDDLYWYDQTSSFGNEAQLKSLIQSLKTRGTGVIADVVINHRKNVSNWVDFPKETNPYDGKSYQMVSTDICKDDDGGETLTWANKNGYSLSSNNDTGEGWGGMRDLDHKSTNVQECVKAYLKYLINYLGYTGFRYDMVKGYSASYTGMYNDYAKPSFSVGECWDGTGTIRNWIDGTKINGTPTSAAFDFQFRYTVRNAINTGNWSRLGNQNDNNWPLVSNNYENGNYFQYAVTFVENHDVQDRGTTNNYTPDPIKKDTLAANAYLLAMPGTPCVFLTHWMAYKQEIKAMIDARKAAGITNTSSYTNLRSSYGLYANLIKVNDKNRLIVTVGSDLSGYTPSTSEWTKILEGYHYAYYLNNSLETAWVDKASGTFSNPLSVKLTAVSATSGAQLVYTLDGSNPTASSSKVNSGSTITINETCTLKVGILKNGSVSGVITREYTFLEAKTITVHVDVSKVNWSNVNFWTWGGDGTHAPTNSNWPGDRVTATKTVNGKTWYYKSFTLNSDDDLVNFVFSTNSGSPQTVDINNVTTDKYFEISTTQTDGKYTVNDVTETVTGINEIESTTPNYNNKVYTIDGRVVRDHYDLNTLPHGIYIYKGKKIVK
ncbi:MAG: chitobiase/beta-hexosaminidase C-terminal domain-containing protein [Prevotella sp.]|nr:chitobiase/beta-hexosaminidase C-terminal domain-containing protein [Prevotella sp.]